MAMEESVVLEVLVEIIKPVEVLEEELHTTLTWRTIIMVTAERMVRRTKIKWTRVDQELCLWRIKSTVFISRVAFTLTGDLSVFQSRSLYNH